MDTPSSSERRQSSSGLPVGLLSPANADLYRRFEVEEAKTNHLRAKESQQSAVLSELTKRLEDINQSLLDEEAHCGKRTTEIKEELERLDREEASLDAQVKQRKKTLQVMTSAVADIKVQLAYNFTTMRKPRVGAQTGGGGEGVGRSAAEPTFDVAQFAESLTEAEASEIVGESYYVDENGVHHKVVFSDSTDDGVGASEAHMSSPASPRGAPSGRRSGERSSRSAKKDVHGRSGGCANAVSRGSWLNSTVSKRATYLLLDNARKIATERLQDIEQSNAVGGYNIDAEYFNDLAAAQEQLATIHKAMRALLLTTPTSSSMATSNSTSLGGSASLAVSSVYADQTVVASPVRHNRPSSKHASSKHASSSGPDVAAEEVELHNAAVGVALRVKPTTSREFDHAFMEQRLHLAYLRHVLQQDEQLLEARRSMPDNTWVAAVQATDREVFESARRAVVADVPPVDPRTTPTPQVAPSSPLMSNATSVRRNDVQTTGRSDAAPRPTSAPSMSRFASAATRTLGNQGSRTRAYEARYLNEGPGGRTEAAPIPPHAPTRQTEYKFRSHCGLLRAVEHRGEAARRERLRQRRDCQDGEDTAPLHSVAE